MELYYNENNNNTIAPRSKALSFTFDLVDNVNKNKHWEDTKTTTQQHIGRRLRLTKFLTFFAYFRYFVLFWVFVLFFFGLLCSGYYQIVNVSLCVTQ